MRRFLHYSSAVACVLLLIFTLALGVYQVRQLVEYVPNASENWEACSDDSINAGSNMCDEDGDRFATIALGAIVPFLLWPAIPIFLTTMKPPISRRHIAAISGATLFITFIVPLSGILLYYNLGR